MFKLTLNGRPLEEGSFENAAIESIAAQMREKIGSIRHPETGEFPTMAFMGDLSNPSLLIEGSPELLALVQAQLGEGSSEPPPASDGVTDSPGRSDDCAPKAFLSYASEDKALAGKIACALMEGGIDTWWDGWCIGPGDSIRQRIDEGISNCTHFIVLLTPRSIEKPWVKTEIDAGFVRSLGEGAKFIPLRSELDAGSLTPLLRTLHSPYIDPGALDATQLIHDIHGMTRRPDIGLAPEPIQAPTFAGAAWSPAAMTVAKYFVQSAEHGYRDDVQREPEKLARELGLSSDDLNDAIFELKGMVIDHHGALLCANDTLFASFDQYWMPWRPAEDAVQVAARLVNDATFPNEPPKMAAVLGWSARRLNPALAYLSQRGLVSDHRSMFANGGFTTVIVRKTDATRRFVKSRS